MRPAAFTACAASNSCCRSPRDARRIDLLHSLASTAPGWGPYRQVVTIHDLIYATIPETHPGIRAWGMRALVPLAARRSDRIITDSRATADDVERVIGIEPGKVDVVPLGVGTTLRATPLDGRELRDRLGCEPDRELVLTRLREAAPQEPPQAARGAGD